MAVGRRVNRRVSERVSGRVSERVGVRGSCMRCAIKMRGAVVGR
jgi:hypothetical protein